ncbi:MAG: STAS domain-containing protein [Streptococcaceae bacterium]|jgi:anti-sigma B factor antagonist|nr:STAS domain-containing protein [Streptococcaceae bacterium]
MLNIDKEKNGKDVAVTLSGRIDTTTAPQLNFIEETLKGDENVVVNLKDIEYISSAGLRFFLKMEKKLRAGSGGQVLTNVSDEVMEIFEISGFAGILTIE